MPTFNKVAYAESFAQTGVLAIELRLSTNAPIPSDRAYLNSYEPQHMCWVVWDLEYMELEVLSSEHALVHTTEQVLNRCLEGETCCDGPTSDVLFRL